MRLARTARTRGEGGLTLLVIVLLIVGGIVWWLYSARQDAEKNIRAFAADVANHVAVQYDAAFLRVHLSPEGQAQFLPSWRDRLFEQLRGLGVPEQPIEIQGDVLFSSYFFDPHATFKAQLKYPTSTGQLELGISRGMTVWQIDNISMYWTPPPSATPGPTPVPSPTAPPPPPPAKTKRKPK